MDRLILFAKYPMAGRVKTRLAKTLGEKKALGAYRQILNKVIAGTHPVQGRYRFTLCLDPPEQKKAFQKHYPLFSDYWVQGEGDLGVRLGRAMEKSFLYKTAKTIIIGSDCPALAEDKILEAFYYLGQKDLVLGPALDGGYYLIGAKKYHSYLFEGIPWSTSNVFQVTQAKAKREGLSFHCLNPLGDVDHFEDYLREFGT